MQIATDYRALGATGQGGSREESQKETLPSTIKGGLVVIGNFDGVHRGHQELLRTAKNRAESRGIPLVVLTFDPHPRLFFQPDQPPFMLSIPTQKAEWLTAAGADAVVSLAFDADLANASAEEFIRHVLLDGLDVKEIMVGENFLFGKKRGGDVGMLREWGAAHGFDVTALPLVADVTGNRVSSGAVREALIVGDVTVAANLLGRPWQMRGRVVQGDQRGRTIGFPTANIMMGAYLRPAFGVYAARVTVAGEAAPRNAVLNLGRRPTIGTEDVRLEVHLLDFDGDLYGKELSVDFYGFIRPEQKFDGLDALKAQIAEDADGARQMLANAMKSMA